MFTEEILKMLFEETNSDFNAWAAEVGYNSEWTDQRIYNALPENILPMLGEIGLNASWMHNGM